MVFRTLTLAFFGLYVGGVDVVLRTGGASLLLCDVPYLGFSIFRHGAVLYCDENQVVVLVT